jgi:hypothetical protein
MIGALAWLTLPATLRYSHVIFNEALGLPFVIVAVFAFSMAANPSRPRPRWLAVGALSMVFAMLSNWEVFFVPVGLLAGSFWNHSLSQRRVALVYLYASAATAVAVLGWYALAYPDLSRDTVQALLYRLGLSTVYSVSPLHNLSAAFPVMTRTEMARTEAGNLARMIGPVGFVALVALCWTQVDCWRKRLDGHSFTVLCGLILPPLIWFALFMNHAAIHEFETVMLAPAVAYAVAWCAARWLPLLAQPHGGTRPTSFWAVIVLGPLLLMVPLLRQIHGSIQLTRGAGQTLPTIGPRPEIMEPDDFVQFGRAIHDRTVPGAVVLTPEMSSVPTYYSWRHLIGGITSDQDLDKVMPIVRQEFRGYPIYLALFSKDRGYFRAALAEHPPGAAADRSVIVKLTE